MKMGPLIKIEPFFSLPLILEDIKNSLLLFFHYFYYTMQDTEEEFNMSLSQSSSSKLSRSNSGNKTAIVEIAWPFLFQFWNEILSL